MGDHVNWITGNYKFLRRERDGALYMVKVGRRFGRVWWLPSTWEVGSVVSSRSDYGTSAESGRSRPVG